MRSARLYQVTNALTKFATKNTTSEITIRSNNIIYQFNLWETDLQFIHDQWQNAFLFSIFRMRYQEIDVVAFRFASPKTAHKSYSNPCENAVVNKFKKCREVHRANWKKCRDRVLMHGTCLRSYFECNLPLLLSQVCWDRSSSQGLQNRRKLYHNHAITNKTV